MIPILYDALCSILKSTILPQSLRADIYLTFGYLYYPEDLYPEEELGPLGFLDDLMLILVVLRKCAIKEKIGIEFIEEHITGLDYSVNQLLTSDFDTITNENKKLFGKLIRRLRKKKGLTLRQLAEQISVSFVNISHIENGRVETTEKVIKELAEALDYDVDKLLAMADSINEDVHWSYDNVAK